MLAGSHAVSAAEWLVDRDAQEQWRVDALNCEAAATGKAHVVTWPRIGLQIGALAAQVEIADQLEHIDNSLSSIWDPSKPSTATDRTQLPWLASRLPNAGTSNGFVGCCQILARPGWVLR
jgi:hypothetical protein